MRALFLLLSCVGCAAAATAADEVAPANHVVVTATRTPTPVDAVLAPVIVIDRDAIERSAAADVTELLRFHAGLELGRNGGPGQTTAVFIRGADSNHTLVAITRWCWWTACASTPAPSGWPRCRTSRRAWSSASRS
jgi:vitamin B12 transporter